MKKTLLFSLVLSLFGFSHSLISQCSSTNSKHQEVKSYSQSHKDVVDIVVSSDVHTTLLAAVKAAGLVHTLKSEGPFTIFAPTNLAFERLPEGTVSNLLKAQNKSDLVSVLTYHVIPAKVSANSLITAVQAGGGSFAMTTVQGDHLTASMKGKHVILTDSKGRISKITNTDLNGTNGVIHVIDQVVLPN